MKKLSKYLKNYKVQTVLAPLFKMLEASFELLVPLVMAGIIDIGIKNNDKPYIYKMAIILVGLGVIGLVCSVTAQYFSAKSAMGFGKELRLDLFKHINKLSYSEIDQIGSSTLITRMTSDVNQIQSGLNLVLRLFLRSPFIVVGAIIMAFVVNSSVATTFVITLPILTVVVFGVMFISIPLYKRVQNRLDKVLLITRENLSGTRVVRAFNKQESEVNQFDNSTDELRDIQIFVGKISAILNPLTYVIVNVAIAVIVWNGGLKVDNGILTQGEVIALVNYMSQILVELIKLANLIISCNKAVASVKRVNTIFDIHPSIEFSNKEVNGLGQAKVEFKNVNMIYKGSKETSIEQVNFKAEKGEVIGIIGGTGSGKTTLVNLIPRFYDCNEGEVLIDGVNVKDYPKEQLRDKIGIVPQKAVLFSGTIEENIRWGKKDATVKDIEDALEISQAKEIVDSKEDGIKYVLNQGAKNLSGGQKQRITIARALVKKPEILILDDSASALDYATDAKLRIAIREKTENMTVFIVSQRFSSIMHADKIIVLDDGNVVGIGSHDNLLENCEIYKEICLSQSTKEEVSNNEK